MKDSLFELLLNFFEKTITQLKKQQVPDNTNALDHTQFDEYGELPEAMPRVVRVQVEQLKSPQNSSIRVFTHHERLKLTKASYQFLVRMASWGIISPETLELIINRLVFSDSRIVSLQETKWTVRNTLASGLSFEQVAFLDLVLYQKEDRFSVH